MSFLPEEYSIPSNESKYAKIEAGDNKFIVLGSVVLGWIYWNNENKPVRLQEKPKESPQDIKVNEKGEVDKVKHFWAIPVYNLLTNQIQILEITQKSLMGSLQDLARDKDWGDPVLKYQITIKKSGQKLDTEYQVLPVPFRGDIDDIKQQYEESEIDMTKYFEKEMKKDNSMETANPYEARAEDIKM